MSKATMFSSKNQCIFLFLIERALFFCAFIAIYVIPIMPKSTYDSLSCNSYNVKKNSYVVRVRICNVKPEKKTTECKLDEH